MYNNKECSWTMLRGLHGDASVDWKMSIHKPHLVAKTLGDTSDEILDVAESSPVGGGGFLGTKPGIDLELLLAFFIGDEIKIKVKMLEITNKLPARSFDFDDLSANLVNAILDPNKLEDFRPKRDDLSFNLRLRTSLKNLRLFREG
ncbi:hypothetical protein MTR_6g033435, partial [Medicago truncatula]